MDICVYMYVCACVNVLVPVGTYGWMLIRYIQWNLSIVDTTGPRKCVLIREVSFVSEVDLYTQIEVHNTIGTSETVLVREALFQRCPLRVIPLYMDACVCTYVDAYDVMYIHTCCMWMLVYVHACM